MASTRTTAVLLVGLAAALAACTADGSESVDRAQTVSTDATVTATPSSLPAAGGVIRSGDSFASMARQYTPGAGSVVATGASAWVPPPPPPAFVAVGPPPPADPPPPPPAAVANRQPAAQAQAPSPAPARPAVPASDIVRPEAAQPESPAPATPNPAVRTAGLALFNNYSCGACHVLADAGATGAVGPSLDRNPRLTRAVAIDVITNGRGAMPAFGGQMSDEEIATLADYVVQFSRK